MADYKGTLKILKESDNFGTGLTFAEALYSGKRYLRCPYNQASGLREGYAEFDVEIDSIRELLTLHQEEFETSNWEVFDEKY